MKYLKRIGLLAGSALLVAGCGSDSDGSAGIAGGVYGADLVELGSGFEFATVDDTVSGTLGVVNEAGQAAFLTDNGNFILWGNVSASLPVTPTLEDDDTVFFAPISGSFEVYKLVEGEYERNGSATINTGLFQNGDYCLETTVDPEDNEIGVGPVSWVAALIRVDEDDGALDIYAEDAEFCAEVTFDDISSEPVVVGLSSDADVDLYTGGWTLADLSTGNFEDEWCDESDSEGLCVQVDENGVVEGEWDGCDINGQLSQPSANLGLNAFSFSGSDFCEEDGSSVGFAGRAFLADEDNLALFLTGDGGAAYVVLTYQEVPPP